MIAPFSYRGTWWSPVYRRSVPGELTFSPERGLHLTVQGSLTPRKGRDSLEHYPILGRATYSGHGSQVTLLNAYAHRRGSHGYPGPRILVEELNVGHALLGAHIRTPDGWLFDSAEIELQHLGTWVDQYGFTVAERFEPYTVTFNWPEAKSAEVPGGWVKIGRTVSQPGGYSHELLLQEQLRIEVTLAHKITLQALHTDWLYPFQNLLTLSMRAPTWVTAVRLFNRSYRYKGKRRPRPLTLFYLQNYTPRIDADEPYWHRQLLRYSDIDDRLQTALSGWLQISRELRAFIEVYFGDRYHPAKYRRSRLLTLMLALEGLHRSIYPNTLRPKAEFHAFVKGLVAAVPEQHQQWLREQLAYSNEPRLRDRILQLAQQFEPVFAPLVGGDLAVFAAFAANARNDTVHASGRRKVATDEELYWLVQKLEFLCEIFLVSRLGFTNAELVPLFERNEQYRIVCKYGQPSADESRAG